MEQVIKVVWNREGKRVSQFATDEWQKEYFTDQWTVPSKGLLFAYKLYVQHDAYDLVAGNEEMWLAEAEIVSDYRDPMLVFSVFPGEWSKWWAVYEQGKYPPNRSLSRDIWHMLQDDHAVMCSKIRLVRRLCKRGWDAKLTWDMEE